MTRRLTILIAGSIAMAVVMGLPGRAAADAPGAITRLFAAANQSLESGPTSREALFAGREDRSTRITGFIDALGAYTYADPAHWSRAVARLQLSAQGELANGVKWKLGGRVDADPVYFASDFYPGAVKRDQRIDFFHRENYVDFSASDWDFRLGAQNIVWGEVVGLFFADVVSARDMREFLLPTFDVIRIPQWAARAEYTRGDHHLELIWIPVQTFDRIGKPGADFYPVPLPHPLPDPLAEAFRDPERPTRSLRNSSYGVRANTLLAGWDIAAFYYRSFSTSPTFYRTAPSATQPLVFTPRYDRLSQWGATVSNDLGAAVLRAEAVYTRGQNFAIADLSSPVGTTSRSTLDIIGSLEWTFANDARLNVQLFDRHYSGGAADQIAFSNQGVGASVFISGKWGARLEPQLLVIRNLKDGGMLTRPRLNWSLARNTTVAFGVDIFSGPDTTFFGRFNNRDRLYTEIRYDF